MDLTIYFLLGVIFFSQTKAFIDQVTTFTIAHSITLIFGGLGYITISPLIIR